MTDTETRNTVKPVAFAKEKGIAPQIVYGWIRNGKLNSFESTSGHKLLNRDEAEAFYAEKEASKQAKLEAEAAAELEKVDA